MQSGLPQLLPPPVITVPQDITEEATGPDGAAVSPHFIRTPTITKNPDNSLTATFKAAGLGNVVTDIYF